MHILGCVGNLSYSQLWFKPIYEVCYHEVLTQTILSFSCLCNVKIPLFTHLWDMLSWRFRLESYRNILSISCTFVQVYTKKFCKRKQLSCPFLIHLLPGIPPHCPSLPPAALEHLLSTQSHTRTHFTTAQRPGWLPAAGALTLTNILYGRIVMVFTGRKLECRV